MGGRERPETVLRAPSGRTFTSLAEMRRVVKVSGLTAVRPATAETRMAGGFRTAEARKSAGAIYSRSAAGMWYDKGQARSSYRGGEGRTSVPSRSHGTSTGRGSESVRPYDRQGTTGGRSYNYYNSGPSRSYERSYQRRYDSPGSFGRSYGGGPHSQSLRPRSGYRLPGRGNYSHGAFSTLGQRSR